MIILVPCLDSILIVTTFILMNLCYLALSWFHLSWHISILNWVLTSSHHCITQYMVLHHHYDHIHLAWWFFIMQTNHPLCHLVLCSACVLLPILKSLISSLIVIDSFIKGITTLIQFLISSYPKGEGISLVTLSVCIFVSHWQFLFS
jgi:hypothetical protein